MRRRTAGGAQHRQFEVEWLLRKSLNSTAIRDCRLPQGASASTVIHLVQSPEGILEHIRRITLRWASPCQYVLWD